MGALGAGKPIAALLHGIIPAVTKRLVIIEDEADIVELVRYNFLKEGFEVRSFARGKEGLEDLRRNSANWSFSTLCSPIKMDSMFAAGCGPIVI